MPRYPGMVERVGGGEREGVALPGWLGALPLPPEGWDDDEERKRTWTRRAGWQNVEAMPCGCCSLAMWWRGVAMASP